MRRARSQSVGACFFVNGLIYVKKNVGCCGAWRPNRTPYGRGSIPKRSSRGWKCALVTVVRLNIPRSVPWGDSCGEVSILILTGAAQQ